MKETDSGIAYVQKQHNMIERMDGELWNSCSQGAEPVGGQLTSFNLLIHKGRD